MYSLLQPAEYFLPYEITHIEENKWNGIVTYFSIYISYISYP